MKQWLPIALCCLPGIVAAAIVGVGVASGGAILGGPLGLGLIVLAMLACPLSMGLMMRGARRDMTNRHDSAMADCCAPDEQSTAGEPDQLTTLRAQWEKLEAEIAEVSKITELEAKRDALPASAKSGNSPQPKEAVH